ncbi:MAG: AAA family ATPase, partial [Desulfobacterales bacterium]
MAKSLYIAGIEPGSGKSMVALGVMELLSRHIHQIGYFRPVIPSKNTADNNIELIRKRYSLATGYEEMYAFDREEVRKLVAEESTDKLLKRIVDRYRLLEGKSRFVLCEGTDFSGIASAFEFEFNAEVAVNLGSPILLMVNGRKKNAADIIDTVDLAQDSFESKGCSIAAVIVNRVASEHLEALDSRFGDMTSESAPVYLLPEIDVLGKPTVKEIAENLEAEVIQGTPEGLYRTVQDLKVAAMKCHHFLDYLDEGDLVITPGDRGDVILAS